MKPHRYRDLLRDLASIPLHPDMSIGRRMEEMGEVLQRHVGAPEHGNRGEEIDTLVIVPEHEIARLQAQLAQAERVVVPECGYRFNTHCLCAVPSSRVLKDGEVAVTGSCVWTEIDEGELWSSTCGHEFTFIHGGPSENSVKFCPFCGGRMEVDALRSQEGGAR